MKSRKSPRVRTDQEAKIQSNQIEEIVAGGTAPSGEQIFEAARVDEPDWVPLAVRSMAQVLPTGKTIADRLLTDKRMKKVWPIVRRTKVASEKVFFTLPTSEEMAGRRRPRAKAIDLDRALRSDLQVAHLDPLERLKTWDIPDGDISLQDKACAALFAYTVMEFSTERVVGTQAQVIKLSEPWLNAAKLCREIMSNDFRPKIDKKFAEALTMVATYLEKGGRLRQQKDSPYIVKLSSGKKRGHDDRTRARARALATATGRIFGKTLYKTVATVTMVALDVENIHWKDVRNWASPAKPTSPAKTKPPPAK